MAGYIGPEDAAVRVMRAALRALLPASDPGVVGRVVLTVEGWLRKHAGHLPPDAIDELAAALEPNPDARRT